MLVSFPLAAASCGLELAAARVAAGAAIGTLLGRMSSHGGGARGGEAAGAFANQIQEVLKSQLPTSPTRAGLNQTFG
ncbi:MULTISPECIES: hypothetical protein [unclassified Amycolatopsis]|uniref:hypothetical protein n=1 Tax=unclassified Amycolatopsis TaxID=2618356 RepID=UPI0028758A3A|nr:MULTISPECIES: hypothetical protein [unclassified Amycolatopsis]MDS0133576.1 hypothetical protein [Amycolatopsis sp. 505]MDS0148579.1 hypothetical protein [Amycolatopsis sp. CM201R]